METVLDIAAVVLAVSVFISAARLVRPANGTRPLLIGYSVSAIFGLYLSIVRITDTGPKINSNMFGIILCIWLAVKLWSIYAVALHDPRPFRLLTKRGFRWLSGDNDDTSR